MCTEPRCKSFIEKLEELDALGWKDDDSSSDGERCSDAVKSVGGQTELCAKTSISEVRPQTLELVAFLDKFAYNPHPPAPR